MNAYEKAQALGLTGTDQHIVDVLKTLTNGDIPAKSLGKWLGERNLLSWDGTGWFGTLQTLLDAGQITGTAADGIRQLKAVLIGPRGDGLETTNPLWAGLVFQTIGGIAAASEDASALIDSFYALDGGRPYKDLTVQEYAAQRTAAEQASIVTTGLTAVRTKIDAADDAARTESRKAGATVQSIVAAANAAWGG